MVQIHPIPILSDNYIWTLRKDSSLIVVDPGDAAPLIAWCDEYSVQPAAILLTHHHADHIGGVPAILARWQVPVYGPARIVSVTQPLDEGDHVQVGGMDFDVWCVPGHTLDHLAYVGEGLVLCGDTLFAGGCGRLFEGSPEEMHASLSRLAALPGETLVCCTHEYTLANLRFAHHVESGNQALVQRMQREAECIAHGSPTLPSTITLERATNPFLRVGEPEVVAFAQRSGAASSAGVEIFAALRRAKDQFRG